MYLERAHRLGGFSANKTRPIIVAFRDFCDTEHIINQAPNLKGTEFGVSRDYPNEISTARQSLWNQFKTIRDNNPHKKVTFGYPANIRINGDIVVDLFPDWYDVLRGSRVSNIQSQSNQPKVLDNHCPSSSETGSTGFCRSVNFAPRPNTSYQQKSSTTMNGPPTTSKQSILDVNRVMQDRDSDIGDSEQLSQSILPQQPNNNIQVDNVSNQYVANENCRNVSSATKVRGRSPTRRAPSDRPRAQSSASIPRNLEPRSAPSVGPSSGRPMLKSNRSKSSARHQSARTLGTPKPNMTEHKQQAPSPTSENTNS